MLYPEISRENGGLPTGTFGTEIKGRPNSEYTLQNMVLELFERLDCLHRYMFFSDCSAKSR
jgi:hypothetical protein